MNRRFYRTDVPQHLVGSNRSNGSIGKHLQGEKLLVGVFEAQSIRERLMGRLKKIGLNDPGLKDAYKTLRSLE